MVTKSGAMKPVDDYMEVYVANPIILESEQHPPTLTPDNNGTILGPPWESGFSIDRSTGGYCPRYGAAIGNVY
jgi:hypothetical protein